MKDKQLNYKLKRSLKEVWFKKNMTSCTLFLQVDHFFYEKFKDTKLIIDELARYVQTLNDIFSPIDFDLDGYPDNLNFVIKKIKIFNDKFDSEYKFNKNLGIERYLEIFSRDNFNDFCLSYMFTRRDFKQGTLGLAWTGDLEKAGGICEKNDVN